MHDATKYARRLPAHSSGSRGPLEQLGGPGALSHPSEPQVAEAQSISAPTCDAEDGGVTQLGSVPIAGMPSAEIAAARNYLIETASPGYTMARQGPELAIGRLNPEFVIRLANAVREARQAGLASVGVFPPIGRPHSGSAVSSTSSTRCTPMGS